MARRQRNRRGSKKNPGDHGPRRSAKTVTFDDDIVMLGQDTPHYLPPQRPRAAGGRHAPPDATTSPLPLGTNIGRRGPRRGTPRNPFPPTPASITSPSPLLSNPYSPRCPTCHLTSCTHHHAHAALPPCAACDFVRRLNYDLRDALAASLASCTAALARWTDDVGVGSGSSVDMMEWQPEGTTLVLERERRPSEMEAELAAARRVPPRPGTGTGTGERKEGQGGGGGPPAASEMGKDKNHHHRHPNHHHHQQQQQQQQPYQAVNVPPTPPCDEAVPAGAGVPSMEVPPGSPQQESDTGDERMGPGVGFVKGGPPVLAGHDGGYDVAGSNFRTYRD